LQQQSTDMAGRHAISGAGATSNLGALGADMTALSIGREGDAAREWAGKRGDLAQEVMANVNTINKDYNDQRDSVLSDMKALEEERGHALASNVAEAEMQRLELERQDRLDKLAEFTARNNVDVQQGYLDLSRDKFGLDTELGRGRLDLDTELGRGNLELSREQLEMQKEQLNTQLEQAEAAMEAADTPNARYMAQLEIEYLESQIRTTDAQANQRNAEALGGMGGSATQFKGAQGIIQWGDHEYGDGRGQTIQNEFLNLYLNAGTQAESSQATTDETMQRMIGDMATSDPEKADRMMQAYLIFNNQDASFSN